VGRLEPVEGRDLLLALADGASALRRLSRDFAYDHNRFVKRGDRDQAAAIATKHYTRLNRHADLLDAYALSLSKGAELKPDENH